MTHDRHCVDHYKKPFLFGIILNTCYVIIEIIYGLKASSMSLVADALHNASDVLGLFIAWGAYIISKSASTDRFTYGFKNSTILATFANAVFIFVMVGGVAWEAIARLGKSYEVSLDIVMVVSSLGVLINGFTAFMLFAGSYQDLNIKGAFLHMLADAAISLGIILSSLFISFTGWFWVDPLVSIMIVILVILSSWGLFKESIMLIFNAVPDHIDLRKVRDYLSKLEGVKEVHDLHVWALSTTETAISVHLIVTTKVPKNFLHYVAEEMKEHFKITHATIQIENSSKRVCQTSC